jgi:hypothetical protein
MPIADLTCIQIESQTRKIKDSTEAYLRSKGWEHTSSTVGSRWMWFKTVEGRHYGCATDDAFRIQSNIDREEYANAHPGEFEE